MRARRSFGAAALAALFISSCATGPLPATGKIPADSPAASLLHAEYFSVWGFGYAGIPTDNERMFHKFLRQKPSAGEILALVQEGSPAGKIYGLLALKQNNPATFAMLARKHLNSRTPVGTVSGCDPSPHFITTGQLVRNIAAGRITIPSRQE